MEELGLKDKSKNILRTIDKIEKLGKEEVQKELLEIGLAPSTISKVLSFIAFKGGYSLVIKNLENLKIENAVFLEGLNDLKEVIKYVQYFEVPESNWVVDLTIARGLDYYTSTVFETILTDNPQLGSVCSGGRYDSLAEYYTDQKLPGVGISIGLTRLFYQLNELNIVSKEASTTTKLLVLPLLGLLKEAFGIATELRTKGISTEVYTDEASNIRKKLEYANKIGVPFVGILGEDEVKEGKITIKNMKSGEQKLVSLSEVAKYLTL
jgi:histidyl-tRNA synthetase